MFAQAWRLTDLLVGLAADAPYLGREELPEWRPTEIGYRVNGIFRQILHTAVSQNVDDPVARWLNQNVPTTDGGRARWPDSVRQLLLANSRVVHNLDRGYVETWVGQNRPFSGEGDTPPYPGVRAGYDQTMRFYQRGNAGPFSLEAAFIMATQVAGVNFRAVARAYNSNPAGWFGALGTAVTSRECLQERDSEGVEVRTYGRFESSGGSNQHDPRAGVYMAFDLDPTLEDDDPNHNVFVFVVHAIDANSVVEATDTQLRAVNVGNTNNWYNLASGSATARVYNQGSSSDTVRMPAEGAGTRLLAVGVEHFRLQVLC
ncbi:hypothetical protein FRC08_004233 [Ceratobasidium sp. 394]|nr:hypothetical protein FRC08_004233 [Ceratobasidium sp. 394]